MWQKITPFLFKLALILTISTAVYILEFLKPVETSLSQFGW